MGRKKLTNEIIDERLAGRAIKRLGDYAGAHTKIAFGCLKDVCSHIWDTKPQCVINDKSGCPKCVDNERKLTNEIIDERLVGRSVKRLENYINSITKILFGCTIFDCAYKWKSTPSNILWGNGCPQCAGLAPLSNNIIDQRLIGKNIKRLNDYVNAKTKMLFGCLIASCLYEWETTPTSVRRCPKCVHCAQLTNDIVDKRLVGRDIKRLEHYINDATPILFGCMCADCLHEWKSTPNNIFNGKGCPKCHRFRKNEKLLFNILRKHANIPFFYDYSIKQIDKTAERALRFDFYFPDLKLAIEYNGAQHYCPVSFSSDTSQQTKDQNFADIQDRDLYKQQFCDEQGIKIIWIDGRIYKNEILETYVKDYILPLCQ